MTQKTPERIWVGTDGRDYHPVFLTENAAKEHGWNDAHDADAPEYIRKDLSDAAVAAEREACAYSIEKAALDTEQGHEIVYYCIRSRTDEDSKAALESYHRQIRAEALREAAAVIGVRVGHGGQVQDCQCGMCVARREDHLAILDLIPYTDI